MLTGDSKSIMSKAQAREQSWAQKRQLSGLSLPKAGTQDGRDKLEDWALLWPLLLSISLRDTGRVTWSILVSLRTRPEGQKNSVPVLTQQLTSKTLPAQCGATVRPTWDNSYQGNSHAADQSKAYPVI